MLLESTLTVADTILTMLLLFAQFFGAFSDSLEHFFHLALLLGQDILKCTFDESGVLAEDRNEYSTSLLRERNSANAAIALALHTGTGDRIEWMAIHVYTIRDSKVFEDAIMTDALAIMQQLGLVPSA